jgi:hypothetical protein
MPVLDFAREAVRAAAGRGTALRRTPTRQQLRRLGNDELRALAGADEELGLCSMGRRGAA